MRALIGLLLLVGIFLIATGLHGSRTRRAREARELQHGLAGDPASSEWSMLVLGTGSGAEPIPGAEPLSDSQAPDEPVWYQPPPQGAAPASPSTPRYSPDYRYIVQKGDVLGRICRQHYGTARMQLVEAVARYNGLETPDAVRIGDAILLPDRTLLGE